MNKPFYFIHPSMVEAMRAEMGGVLPGNCIVLDKLPKMRRPGMRPRPASRPKTVFQPRSKSA
jgi:hypothetical protein